MKTAGCGAGFFAFARGAQDADATRSLPRPYAVAKIKSELFGYMGSQNVLPSVASGQAASHSAIGVELIDIEGKNEPA